MLAKDGSGQHGHLPASRQPYTFPAQNVFGWFLPYQQHPTFPVILDTGATITITPDHTDFGLEYTPSEGDVLQGLAAGLQIEGTGTVQWAFHLDFGLELELSLPAYYVLRACQHLLSPQHFLQHSSPNIPDKHYFVINVKLLTFVTSDDQHSTIQYDQTTNLPTLQMWKST